MTVRKTACIILAALALPLGAQDILTAENFFESAQEVYGTINDYQARISIAAGKQTMTGTLIYKNPGLLRIDFTQPSSQVICFNKDQLTVYLPDYRAVLSQQAAGAAGTGASGANLASRQGLVLMKRYYSIGYETGPAPVPLDAGSGETVVKLNLARKTVSEGFKTISLSVNPVSKLIRRITGVTLSGDSITFDFQDIKLNTGIADVKFIYDSPASANLYNDFLFKSEQ